MNKLFALRYAIYLLNSQLKNQMRNEDNSQFEPFPIYRGAYGNGAVFDELAFGVGSIIARTSFACCSFDENKAKSLTSGDMKNPQRQPIVEKGNFTMENRGMTHGYFSQNNQTSDNDASILPYQSLFRIDKLERTERCWCLDVTAIDEGDEEFRSLLGPWAKLIDNEQHRFVPIVDRVYFRYLDIDSTSFLRFQVIVDALLRLESNVFAKEELIELYVDQNIPIIKKHYIV